MLYKLDESVGKLVTALKEKNMLQDSIIVFTTDNGGPASGFNQNAASNYPLKGVSTSLNHGLLNIWASLSLLALLIQGVRWICIHRKNEFSKFWLKIYAI